MRVFDLDCSEVQPTRTGCNLVVDGEVVTKTSEEIQERKEAVQSLITELEREEKALEDLQTAIVFLNQV